MMPKDALAELVAFIADNESFHSIDTHLQGTMKVAEVRGVLRDLSLQLRRDAASEACATADIRKDRSVKRKTKDVLSCLSSSEEKRLLKACGFEEV